MSGKRAVIIGAGPGGLTAAHELLARTDIVPLVIEMSDLVGGISRTVNYKGNRIDIGGHRFFSKSDRVMQWWLQRMPLQKRPPETAPMAFQQAARQESAAAAPDPDSADRVMLVRGRKSRIYFLGKFFDYPLRMNMNTLVKLGFARTGRIALSYAWAVLFANKHPRTLEEFFIGRFGRELYRTFFKSYTEKVWGESCADIGAEWGAQRIKGLSLRKALLHLLASPWRRNDDVRRRTTETSLIDEFLYPKRGPGQMWEIVADEVAARGGTILLQQRATRLRIRQDRLVAVEAVDQNTGRVTAYPADYVFSTMPVKELLAALDVQVPGNVREVGDGLRYRDFITVGLLLKGLGLRETSRGESRPIKDNWIYIQEPDVKAGRLQIFNNWSPYMVADPNTAWIGVEYFCHEGDDLWCLADADLVELAKTELARIDMIETDAVLDATVLRMPKAYPSYSGTYPRFGEIRAFVDRLANLYLIGRNGMHKYNNQDHSMLTAMTAVDNICCGRSDKSNVWEVNSEQEHHETRSE